MKYRQATNPKSNTYEYLNAELMLTYQRMKKKKKEKKMDPKVKKSFFLGYGSYIKGLYDIESLLL